MEPFEAAPPRGFRLNRKVYVKTVRHLDDMPMYPPTNRDGVAVVYHCNEGETAETAIDRLCDRLGGAAHAEPSLITGAGTKTQRRGSHGTWSSSIMFYGKLEAARMSSRTCAAPLVCPNMPEDLRLAPYTMPDDDADDALLTAAIERAELERSPAYKGQAADPQLLSRASGEPLSVCVPKLRAVGDDDAQALRGYDAFATTAQRPMVR